MEFILVTVSMKMLYTVFLRIFIRVFSFSLIITIRPRNKFLSFVVLKSTFGIHYQDYAVSQPRITQPTFSKRWDSKISDNLREVAYNSKMVSYKVWGPNKKGIKNFGWERKGKIPLRRPRHRWKEYETRVTWFRRSSCRTWCYRSAARENEVHDRSTKK